MHDDVNDFVHSVFIEFVSPIFTSQTACFSFIIASMNNNNYCY